MNSTPRLFINFVTYLTSVKCQRGSLGRGVFSQPSPTTSNKRNIQLKTACLLCKHVLKAKPPASTFNHIEIPKANPYGYFEATTVLEGNVHFSLLQLPFLRLCLLHPGDIY